ncbi:YdhK family protein [Bacillus atrophaeus]|uniref:YdhK family protein n=1 Tax=Bacillus atrophaeus TaxID=1452 RepID=UPI003D244837
MKRNTTLIGIVSLLLLLMLSACGSDNQDKKSDQTMNMDDTHTHSESSEIPEGLTAAQHPTYKVGSQAIIKADHMKGMKGAEATITGAYDTTAYAVSYTPTTGGTRVENHKWVIQEEIKNASDETLKPGTDVIIEADHMKRMKGATGKIDSAEKTTVYTVDYTPTTGGEKVKNHKWVTESELSSK